MGSVALDIDRIRMVLTLFRITQSELARASGVSTAMVSLMLADKEQPSMRTAVALVHGLEKLLDGKTLGIDATTLEANAALRSIVRRDTSEDYKTFLEALGRRVGHRDAAPKCWLQTHDSDHGPRPTVPVSTISAHYGPTPECVLWALAGLSVPLSTPAHGHDRRSWG